MITTNYDQEADVFHVRFAPDTVRYDFAQEIAPGVFLEFDEGGQPVGVEVISASKRPLSPSAATQAAAE